MKKQVIFLLSILLVGATTWYSCTPESEPQRQYYNSYGTIHTEDNLNFTVRLDNGSKLIPENLTIEGIVQDARVLLGFYIVSEDSASGDYIINAEVAEMYNVYTLDITQLTEELEDSVGTDGIIVPEYNLWMSEKHLNVSFSFYGGGTVHAINLVKPIGEQRDEDGNQILELRHNANGDLLGETISGTISFTMEPLYEDGMDSINFAFHSYDYDSVLTEIKSVYYFKNHVSSTKSIKMGPIDFDPNYSYLQLQ